MCRVMFGSVPVPVLTFMTFLKYLLFQPLLLPLWVQTFTAFNLIIRYLAVDGVGRNRWVHR